MANIKNEPLLEEENQKKKLYKSWKPYVSILAIIIITGSIAIGIYSVQGHKNHNRNTTPPNITIPITPINLNTLNQTAILGKENIKQDDVFNLFIKNNKEKYPDLTSNVEVSSFTAPSYTSTGKLVIKARTNSTKYNGEIIIIINTIKQTALNTLNLNLFLTTSSINQNDAFDAFINLNSQISDLKNNVKISSFIAPKDTSEGKLIINATANGKYSGSVKVNIPEIEAFTIRDKILQRIKQAQQNNDITAWENGWLDYQLFLESDVESHTFVLTQEQLANSWILQNILIKQFFTNVETDLEKWNLPKDFIENFNIVTFDFTKITNTTITFYATIGTIIYGYFNNTRTPMSLQTQGNFYVSYVKS